MDPQAIRNLDKAVALTRSPRIVRALRHPFRMFGSKLTERRAHSQGGAFPALATTFWGAPFHAMIPEGVSTTIYRYGFFEEELTRAFIDILKPGMTFFDVGSHFGYFSLLARELVGPAGAVHAFDPTPSTFEMLRKNVGHLSNVTTINAAAFSTETTLQFTDFGVEFSAYNSISGGKLTGEQEARAKLHQVNVKAITIDGYIERTGVKPNVMKIDAEGAELEILKGMEKTLTVARPIVTLEVGDVGAAKGTKQSRTVVDHILARGYKPFEYKNGNRLPHSVLETYPYTNIVFFPA